MRILLFVFMCIGLAMLVGGILGVAFRYMEDNSDFISLKKRDQLLRRANELKRQNTDASPYYDGEV